MPSTVLDRVKQVLAPFVHQVLVYDASPPTIEDGDVRPAQMGASGGMLVEVVGGGLGGYAAPVPHASPTGAPQQSPARLLFSGAGRVRAVNVTYRGAGSAYLMLFDAASTAAASDANLIRWGYAVDAMGLVNLAVDFPLGVPVSAGLVAALSSTQGTYTASADAAYFWAQWET